MNIPNTNFKKALVNSQCADFDGDGIFESDVDLNDDGEIQITDAESVLNLGVNSNNILSFEGIDAFVNLQGLDCSYNSLSTLDLCALTNLVFLNCHGNNLPQLDFTGLTNLICLYYGYNQLTTLDVSPLINL